MTRSFLLRIALLLMMGSAVHLAQSQTMTFNTAAAEPGFTFTGWGWWTNQIIYPLEPNVNGEAIIQKNTGCWNITSFGVTCYAQNCSPPGGGTWQVTSDQGHSATFMVQSFAQTITLNWNNIHWFKLRLILPGNGNPNNTFDFDNVVYQLPTYTPAAAPSLSLGTNPGCPGTLVPINISGSLNSANQWAVYTGSCGSTLVTTTTGSSVSVTPFSTTTYYVRGIDPQGCADPGPCTTITIAMTDTDGDGLADCQDPCPTLPNLSNGQACDDGNACTINDVVTSCVCAGTLQDTDNDGICDANDPCPLLSDLVNGDPCDDNNACTINDVVTNCVCAGTPQDTDGDGICDANDPCPTLANLQNGDPCDDGIACTVNDVVLNCMCSSTLSPDTDGDGLCDATDPCPNVANAQDGMPCDDDNPCTVMDMYAFGCQCIGMPVPDTDVDGICDINDPCPFLANLQNGDPCDDNEECTINDVVQANCVCQGEFQDTDGDGNCDAFDPCPFLADLENGQPCDDGDMCTAFDMVSNCVCSGQLVGFDTDGDGTCDLNDPCPFLANLQNGDACDDNEVCTINDVVTNCVCAGTFEDTDNDGTCDANDPCPTTPLQDGDPCDDGNPCSIGDMMLGCECMGLLDVSDSDGDGICNSVDNCPFTPGQSGDPCDDGNAGTINDAIQSNCACIGFFNVDCEGLPGGPAQPGTPCDDNNACTTDDIWSPLCECAGTPSADTDADGVCDITDNCPFTFGQIGDACDDGNSSTSNDVIDVNCVCSGTLGGCQDHILVFDQNEQDGDNTWMIRDANTQVIIATGGPYAAFSSNVEFICLPTGACYDLIVTDLGGNGLLGGGWVLLDPGGHAVINNENNGGGFTTVAMTALPFCTPVSTSRLIESDCDRENFAPNANIFASADPAVSAEWGIGDQTDDGYQFWFFNPNGGYTRRIFRNHATSGGFGPADAIRATKLAFSSIVTNPLPQNVLLNVRVRTRVNGVNGDWGPACRLKIDPTGCTLTQLNNDGGSPYYSCGGVSKEVGASGNDGKLFANVVYQGNTPANRYKFQLSLPGEGYMRHVVSQNAALLLSPWATNPLLCGQYTYEVRVAASFDGGLTFCPFGPMCTVDIVNDEGEPYCTQAGMMPGGEQRTLVASSGAELMLWPNPNKDRQLFVQLTGLGKTALARLEIISPFGQRVMDRTIAVANGTVNTELPLGSELAAGLYIVQITAGEQVLTERLVIE